MFSEAINIYRVTPPYEVFTVQIIFHTVNMKLVKGSKYSVKLYEVKSLINDHCIKVLPP